jgi:hypothetical protein
MGLVRLPCFFNSVQRIERYSTTSSKMIKNGIGGHLFSNSKPWKQAPNHHHVPSIVIGPLHRGSNEGKEDQNDCITGSIQLKQHISHGVVAYCLLPSSRPVVSAPPGPPSAPESLPSCWGIHHQNWCPHQWPNPGRIWCTDCGTPTHQTRQ